jgi:hypothetical protein
VLSSDLSRQETDTGNVANYPPWLSKSADETRRQEQDCRAQQTGWLRFGGRACYLLVYLTVILLNLKNRR